MAEKRTIDLEINSNLVSLKTQFKEAQLQVQILSEKFGATSKQAVEAAKNAAILKDKILDAKSLTDAFNPDAKFKALSGSLNGVAGGFSVVTGAMAVFGKQSDDVQKALLKVQSAMALASGLQAVGESIDSFKQLKATIVDALKGITTAKVAETVATEAGVVAKEADAVAENQGIIAKGKKLILTGLLTAAQYVYNLAMSLNPIGLIVISVTALIAAGYALINMFMAQNKANIEAEAGTKRATAALNAQIKSAEKASNALETKNEHEFNMAKAAGASAEALRKLALKHADETIALDQASYATAKNTYEKEKNTLANLQSLGVGDEQIKKQTELVTKARENATKEREDLSKSYEAKQAIIRANEVELVAEKFNAEKKTTENSKGSAKEQIDITRQLQDEKLKLVADGEQKELDVIKLAYSRKNEDREKDVKDGKMKRKDANILIAQDILNQQTDEQKVRNKFSEARIKKEDEDFLKLQKLTLSEREFAKLELAQKFDEQQLQAKGNAELTAELTKQQQKELDALNVTFNAKELADKQNLEKAKLDAKKQYDSLVLSAEDQAIVTAQEKAVTELTTLKTNLDNKLITEEQFNTARKAVTEKSEADIAKIKIDAELAVAEQKAKIQQQGLETASQGINLIKGLFEKSKGVQKAAVIAESAVGIAKMIISNKLANAGALATPQAIASSGASAVPVIALNNISTGIGVAANIAATAKALKALGGGAAPSAPTGTSEPSGGSGGATAPQFNVVGNSGINQLAQLQQTPMQAFVVSGEVTSAQSLDRNRIQNATL